MKLKRHKEKSEKRSSFSADCETRSCLSVIPCLVLFLKKGKKGKKREKVTDKVSEVDFSERASQNNDCTVERSALTYAASHSEEAESILAILSLDISKEVQRLVSGESRDRHPRSCGHFSRCCRRR